MLASDSIYVFQGGKLEKLLRALCEENKELAQDAAYQTDMACQCDIAMGQVLRQRDELKAWQEAAFKAYPNIDLDIEYLTKEARGDEQ